MFILISIAIIIIITVVIIYIAYAHMRPRPKPSLYDRLGGVFAIAAVVDHFSDALIHNPIVGVESKNPQLSDWSKNHLDRLPGLKFMRTLWVCALAGGPYKYSPTRPGKCPFSLESAHSGLKISPEEFDAVAAELANSLDHFKVLAGEKSEVLAAFSAHKDDVTAGYYAASGMPAVIKC